MFVYLLHHGYGASKEKIYVIACRLFDVSEQVPKQQCSNLEKNPILFEDETLQCLLALLIMVYLHLNNHQSLIVEVYDEVAEKRASAQTAFEDNFIAPYNAFKQDMFGKFITEKHDISTKLKKHFSGFLTKEEVDRIASDSSQTDYSDAQVVAVGISWFMQHFFFGR